MGAVPETMVYVGQPAWHGIGTEVPAGTSLADATRLAGLDYEVEKRKIYYAAGKDSKRVIKDKFALVRATDGEFYDVCSPKYHVHQPADGWSFMKRFTDAGHMHLNTVGQLFKGKFLWGLADVGSEFRVGREDVVKGHLLIVMPYVVGRPTVIKHVNTRVVCENTLGAALGENGGEYRVSHVKALDQDVYAMAEKALGLSHERLAEFQAAAETLSQVHVSSEQVDAYFRTVFKLTPADLEVRRLADGAETADTSRVLPKLHEALEHGPGANLPGTRGTAWGALNAVTFVEDHVLGRDREKTLRDNWLGYRGVIKQRALAEALKLA